jgi:polysaccharide biosynthesis protein PelA
MTASSFARMGVSWVVVACVAIVILLLSVAWVRPALAACKRASSSGIGSVAFYYGDDVQAERFEAFDTVVVESDSGFDPRAHLAHCPNWYAYVSVGEANKERAYFTKIPKKWLIGRNAVWASTVIDQTAPGWPEFFVDEIIKPLWDRGYRGFFFDTLDSYQLVASTDAARAAQEAGLVAVLERVKARYPEAQLILNRGFEILPRVHEKVAAVAFESLFGNWDQTNQRYDAVPENDREWLLAQARVIHDRYRLPVISIDYCAVQDDACRRSIVEKILALGVEPYVTDGGLQTVGVGSALVKGHEPVRGPVAKASFKR